MRTRLLACTALAAAALIGAGAGGAFAQSAPGYAVPHTADGRPDLQGFWNNTSITSLQRSPDAKTLVVDEKDLPLTRDFECSCDCVYLVLRISNQDP